AASSPPSPFRLRVSRASADKSGFGAAAFPRFASEGWWARQDSNLQPGRYERPALTIELQAPRFHAALPSFTGQGLVRQCAPHDGLLASFPFLLTFQTPRLSRSAVINRSRAA